MKQKTIQEINKAQKTIDDINGCLIYVNSTIEECRGKPDKIEEFNKAFGMQQAYLSAIHMIQQNFNPLVSCNNEA